MSSVGIKDVARRAGVSIGTVSHVLNHPERVGPETRLKVEAAIASLGYVRNESARQLRAGSSRCLAYLTMDAANPFFTDVARGAESLAREYGLALFVCNSDGDPARENDNLDLLLEQRMRGVLITALNYANPRLKTFQDRAIPVVLVDRTGDVGDQFCSVGVDDVEGGELAGAHLLEQGHKIIGFAGGPASIPQVADRFAGLTRAVESAGAPPDTVALLQTANLTVDAGGQVAQRLLGLPSRRRPTAVFCANDLIAMGLLQGLTQKGVTVPDDVAIVGYDDIAYAGAAAVPLSSVRQPRTLLGRTAVDLLLAEEADAGGAHEHQQVTFHPELVVRDSSLAGRRARR